MGNPIMTVRNNSDSTTLVDEELGHHDTGRELLNPRPSDDPEDPLNWPLWLKVSFLFQDLSITAHLPLLIDPRLPF